MTWLNYKFSLKVWKGKRNAEWSQLVNIYTLQVKRSRWANETVDILLVKVCSTFDRTSPNIVNEFT